MPSQAAAQPGHRLALKDDQARRAAAQQVAMAELATGDLDALSQALGYWTTSPGFDSRWMAREGERGVDKDGLGIAGRAAAQRADRYAVPVVEAIDAVVAAREALAKAEARLLMHAGRGHLAKALAFIPDEDRDLSVHGEAATQGMDADRLVATLASIAKGAA